jgi:hypothetical protein
MDLKMSGTMAEAMYRDQDQNFTDIPGMAQGPSFTD